MRVGALAALVCCGPLVSKVAAQSARNATRQQILVAEDARGHGVDGVAPIVAGLQSSDTLVRRLAVRAIGRLQRPDLTSELLPLLRDDRADVRSEAANALAQSVSVAGNEGGMQAELAVLADSIAAQLDRETDTAAAELEADALGRLPYADSVTAARAQHAIVTQASSHIGFGGARALYWLATNRRAAVGLSNAAVAALRAAVRQSSFAPTRRMALATLIAGKAADSVIVAVARRDVDEQVRRLVVTTLDPSNTALLASALHDRSSTVRVAALQVLTHRRRPADCVDVIDAIHDSVMYVRLAAIDALAARCADSAASAGALAGIITRSRPGLAAHAWQEPAHALVALARVDAGRARPLIDGFAKARCWQERMYAARAAAPAAQVETLATLVRDSDHNVVEAAIDGLHALRGHAYDSLYIAALASNGHQQVRAAALALRGTSAPAALPALLASLSHLTSTRSENTRDPRVAILGAVAPLGTAADSTQLMPYLADYDSTVAALAATILSRWAGHAFTAHPVPLPLQQGALARVFGARSLTLVVTLADSTGGGSFTVTLFPAETPATVARILRLVRSHYYDGHVFHRVEPDFVVQGGGTDASEYAGADAFMRDELTSRSNSRGTLGISTRGRDTGDAQWFINLVDNPRLDHDYTVFGEITAGRDVAERIQEDDVIAHVTVREMSP